MKHAFELAAELGSPVMVCGWFLIAFARNFCTQPTEEEQS